MNAEELISLVRNRLGGRRFHEEVIRYNIGRAFAMFMSEEQDLTPYRKDFYDVEVNIRGSKYYSTLPVTPLNVRDSIRITTIVGVEVTFEREDDGQAEIFNELEVSKVSDIIGFKLRTDKVWYNGIGDEIDVVDMAIVLPFEEYDYTDEIYLPVGSDELIIETTTNFLLGTPPSLDINDGTN